MLVGFGASSYLTLLFCAAYYLVDDVPTTETVQRRTTFGKITIEDRSNPIDHFIRKRIASRLTMRRSAYFYRWKKAFHGAVLSFSDQQSLTGIAILISGFSQLGCSLSTYHWQLTFDLAWFSSLTHLATLTCLRRYFWKRPALRLWRLISMALTCVFLSTALISTGHISLPYTEASFPAWCLFHPNISATAGNQTPYNSCYIGITLGFLIFSYTSRTIQLFPTATAVVLRWTRARPSSLLQTWIASVEHHALKPSNVLHRVLWALLYRFILSLSCMLEAMTDLWSSLLWEVVRHELVYFNHGY